jgi:hypothetical protein
MILAMTQATKGFDPGELLRCNLVLLTLNNFILVTGLGTPNWPALKHLVVHQGKDYPKSI